VPLRKIRYRRLLVAVLTTGALAASAAFGGPHGSLGVVPWLLNLPGILLVVAVPSDAFVPVRLAAGLLVQVVVWYSVLSWWSSRGRAAARSDGGR